MITVVHESRHVDVPTWVTKLSSFRRWSDSPQFPDDGRIWFLKGVVWVDMSKEQIYTHVHLKTEFTIVVGGLARAEKRGLFLADGAFFTNADADVAGIPDAIFIANETLESGQVRLVEGTEQGYVEVEGSPDMMLEVVSDSSVTKDLVTLRQAYWEAGVREYWIVDARKSPARFDILRWASKGFVAVRKQGGWLKSDVFGKAFRLQEGTTRLGHPEFTLEIR